LNAVASFRSHPVYKDALICQLVAFILTGMCDAPAGSALLDLSAYVLFWVGLMLFLRFRVAPTKPELFFVRVGPLFVFILMFVISQYV
jgi:hypothetical protein